MQLREGFCNYCKEGKMVEVSDHATQEQVNEEVTQQCRCTMASRIRERKLQKETCIANIDEMLQTNYPVIARVFKDNIDAMQDSKIKKITINTYGNQTARMSKTKDGIKVELEKKQKNESLA